MEKEEHNIKEELILANITAKELAQFLNLPNSAVSNVLNEELHEKVYAGALKLLDEKSKKIGELKNKILAKKNGTRRKKINN